MVNIKKALLKVFPVEVFRNPHMTTPEDINVRLHVMSVSIVIEHEGIAVFQKETYSHLIKVFLLKKLFKIFVNSGEKFLKQCVILTYRDCRCSWMYCKVKKKVVEGVPPKATEGTTCIVVDFFTNPPKRRSFNLA